MAEDLPMTPPDLARHHPAAPRLAVFNPYTVAERAARDELLQAALRPEPLPFGIAAEYPLVLGERGAQHSYCATLRGGGAVVAHANLWPRQLIAPSDGEGPARLRAVGLVGNVATSAGLRGQGLMSELMGRLVERGRELGLELLILWSDLDKFYQKLGFSSLGGERRLRFDAAGLAAWRDRGAPFLKTEAASLNAADVQALLDSRPRLPSTLERSADEMRRLLGIPRTDLFVRRRPGGAPDAYVVVGKGYDMVGVVHDWGGSAAADAISGVQTALRAGAWPELMLLAPAALAGGWLETLRKYAAGEEAHAMALGRFLGDGESPELVKLGAALFIWGLDSI
jgi:GNAT superfamily N-acetyltransferase